MKNIIKIISLLLIVSSCTKHTDFKLSNNDSIYHSNETKRIIEVFTHRSIEININYDKNRIPELAGNTFNNKFNVTLADKTYFFENESISYKDESIREYVGKTKQFSITKEGIIKDYSIYVPMYLEIDNSTIKPFSSIKRTGNVINWNMDDKNLAGIMLSYTLLGFNEQGKEIVIDNNMIIIEDDGSFNLDPLIENTKIKEIRLHFSRGNAVSYEWSNKKLAFYFVTSDILDFIKIED